MFHIAFGFFYCETALISIYSLLLPAPCLILNFKRRKLLNFVSKLFKKYVFVQKLLKHSIVFQFFVITKCFVSIKSVNLIDEADYRKKNNKIIIIINNCWWLLSIITSIIMIIMIAIVMIVMIVNRNIILIVLERLTVEIMIVINDSN